MPKIRKPYVLLEDFEERAGSNWTPAGHTHIASDVRGLTQGLIPFAAAGGFLIEDAALFWDAAENNLGIGTQAFGATMTQGIQIATGLAPTANVADTFAFYSADFVGGNACPHFRTEAGTVIGLNQSLFTTDTVVFADLTVGNLGLHILDTGGDHYLTIKPNEDLSASRVLSIVTGDAARTITLSGNPTLADWFDQAVKQASNVSFGTIGCGTITVADGSSISLQEDITFTGATTENKILIPDNLPDALSISEAGNEYITFVTTNGGERVYFLKDIATDRWLNSDLNVFLGVRAAGAGTLSHVAGNTGWHNVAIGYDALRAITTGYMNVAIGTDCLRANLAGRQNVGLGYAALYKNTTGYQNMAIGYHAMLENLGGFQNIAIGYGALYYNVAGSANVAIGVGALQANTASGEVGIGHQAGALNSGGWGNTVIGYECAISATAGYQNVYIGRQCARNQFGATNVAIGYQAFYGSGTAGTGNVVIGFQAGMTATTAHYNTLIGYQAGQDITTGDGNVCLGYMAGEGWLIAQNNLLVIANSDTATPLIYGTFPNTLLRIRATDFEVIGTSKLGDGGATNYANVAPDGTITLLGTAKVTKRLFLANAAFAKGATAPVQVILGNMNGWEFDIGDDAVMTSRIPDDWDPTTALTIKVCWFIDEAYAVDKEIQWRVDWSALPHDFSEAVDAPTHSGFIESGDIDIPAVAKRMGATTIGTIAAANLSAGDMLGLKLSRIAVTEDDPTAKPTAHNIIIEYTADRIGT